MFFKRVASFAVAIVILMSVCVSAFALGAPLGDRYNAETYSFVLPDNAVFKAENDTLTDLDDDVKAFVMVKVDKNTNDLRPSNVDIPRYKNSVAADIKNLFKDVDEYCELVSVDSDLEEIGNYNVVKTAAKMNVTYLGRIAPVSIHIYVVMTKNYVHYFYVVGYDEGGTESYADGIAQTIVVDDEDVKDGFFQRYIVKFVTSRWFRRIVIVVVGALVGLYYYFRKLTPKERKGLADDGKTVDGMTQAERRIYLEQQRLNRENDEISHACENSNTDDE